MAGKVTSTAPVVAVSTKYPVPVTAVKSTVLGVVSQDTTPVPPKPVAVPGGTGGSGGSGIVILRYRFQ